jgi:hypothetical protein
MGDRPPYRALNAATYRGRDIMPNLSVLCSAPRQALAQGRSPLTRAASLRFAAGAPASARKSLHADIAVAEPV